ncbi:flagellar basal body P-ring formation protein FlgA [Falsochrobactrum sp. TDYN1]|uniref:Flagella basal body P-ring formation protein FlgA n=1 Tax=Falsochrobactrum tianjinense TaxID=2706015 RepID=A0A949PPA1_9HYPH|nr:flagellar basal body P-ring formation chaperone FlgA [Falsochrobactrum sp. TDYN1]MBV2144332.1 flagellar basal body P-ring formation protein FlgA [Falsochrobactrum sp. TDYN1]
MKRAKALLQKRGLVLIAALVLSMVSAASAADRIAFVVPSATVYPGQVVSDTALVEKSFFINAPAANQYVLSPDQAAGKVARKTLLPGKPILVSALAEPSLVKRGVPAPLVFNSGMLSITTMGTPLESGAAGDFIKIRNIDSGIIVSGTVLADGRIQVGMQ